MDTEKKGYQDRHKGRRAQKMKPKEILKRDVFRNFYQKLQSKGYTESPDNSTQNSIETVPVIGTALQGHQGIKQGPNKRVKLLRMEMKTGQVFPRNGQCPKMGPIPKKPSEKASVAISSRTQNRPLCL